jgi:hypothetical protein
MLQAIVQSYENLGKFLDAFRDAFKNSPQYRHFQAYVVGLIIYLGSRNLAGLSRAIPAGKSACSLYRFVAKMDWDTERVEQVRWELLNRRTRRILQAAGRRGKTVPVFLIIDDSLVEKSGKQMEGVGYHYSHSTGRTALGHVWVTGHLLVSGQSYPVSWKLYRRKVTCDESDRKFKTARHNLQVQQWAEALPKRAFDFVTVNTVCYKVWSKTGRLSSGHTVRLVVNRVVGRKKWRYLISTDRSLSPQTTISYYLGRWKVENFYRVAKQSLGWGDYQMRELFAIERHVQLMMVAHAYLESERQDALAAASDPDAHITLGDIQRKHQTLSRRAEIAQVFDLARRGFKLDTIYQRLAA